MKRIYLIFIVIFSANLLFAQTYTEKYSSIRERMEYFDANGNMIAYKKWNRIRGEYEITYLNKSRKKSRYDFEYTPEYNMKLLARTIEYKQKRYDKNKQKANYVAKILLDDKDLRKIFGDTFFEIQNGLDEWIARYSNVDYSKNLETAIVIKRIFMATHKMNELAIKVEKHIEENN